MVAIWAVEPTKLSKQEERTSVTNVRVERNASTRKTHTTREPTECGTYRITR